MWGESKRSARARTKPGETAQQWQLLDIGIGMNGRLLGLLASVFPLLLVK